MIENLKIIKKDIKNINIRVKATKEVILSAPLSTTDKKINEVLIAKKSWILKKIKFFSQNVQIEPKFIDNKAINYLGKKYQIEIYDVRLKQQERISLEDNYLKIYIKNRDIKRVEKTIITWYRQKADIYFRSAIDRVLNITKKKINRLSIRKMKSRWGSCYFKKKHIVLNLYLIQKKACEIEYVILHEVAHLTYPKHDKAFYDYLKSYMPDWESRVRTLNFNSIKR